MPPLSSARGKSKGTRDARRSRSRNTTPSSIPSATTGPQPSYLDNDMTKLLISSTLHYTDILEDLGSSTSSIPDHRSLDVLVEQLKMLSQLADQRGDACNVGMRELSQKLKDAKEEMRNLETMEREAEERRKMTREVEADDGRASKGGKLKKKKDKTKEERPLTHGAHGVARQDGVDVKTENDGLKKRSGQDLPAAPAKKMKHGSSGSSSLSPPSAASPSGDHEMEDAKSQDEDSDSDESSSDERQPAPASSSANYQLFGPNPLTCPDDTIYHIREVTKDMTDDEKKDIYCVSRFPKRDLLDMMACDPPDKDFSGAKPTNQVNANTFATYLEPYVRPYTEEDSAFLKERGDRTTAFVINTRNNKHYTDIWAEEDGSMALDAAGLEGPALNKGRGNIDQMNDTVAEGDQFSIGPMAARLMSLLRFENRSAPTDDNENSMEIDSTPAPNGENAETQPSASSFPEISSSTVNARAITLPKLDHAQLDERLKVELRHTALLSADDAPNYDNHFDDDLAERLRALQAHLKHQVIVNGARKVRLQEMLKERMAYQEYTTIHDDLDSQVQQAYLKRTRTLGKSKKGSGNKNRPGAAAAANASAAAGQAGVGRPGLGDVAKTLMERRRRWSECIGPVFKDMKATVPKKEESIFEPAVMAEYEKAEMDGWGEVEE